MDECKPLMMGRSAVCHVCDNFDVNVRGRELEQVRTQGPAPGTRCLAERDTKKETLSRL